MAWPNFSPFAVGQITCTGENHDTSSNGPDSRDFREYQETKEARPNELGKIEWHDQGRVGFLQGLGKKELSSRTSESQSRKPEI